ncbi:MAG: ATP-binding cassette domain-containing protein [Gammaproteobacteria bacterium]|nr:ATP-binding cassette domain-containing protein [Gammaproteobacteria bacterium]
MPTPNTATLLALVDTTLQRHAGAHIGHSDLQTLLHISDWRIAPGQHWGIIGGREEQRTALLDKLRETNAARATPLRCAEISLHEQQRYIDAERIKSKTGVADELFAGTRVEDMLASSIAGSQQRIASYQSLVEQLDFQACLNKHFRELSTGETRRLLIIDALVSNTELLLLHDPLEGLDSDTRPRAAKIIDAALRNITANRNAGTNNAKQPDSPPTINCSVFASSRAEQLPAHTTHIACIDGTNLRCTTLSAKHTLADALRDLQPLLAPTSTIALPGLPKDHPYHQHKLLDPAQPLVRMRNVNVRYAEQSQPVLDQLDWTVYPLQHWRISGRNGSGKTTLLKLVSGDHPQVYQNDIEVCGFQRGNGESIWQVKRHIGYMGSEMLWNYRASGQLAGKAISVVMSGLYDSIGLYTQTDAADKNIAQQWLALFDLAEMAKRRFQSLGLAEQRVVLIARAMIKRPSLLILDEPLQGLDSADRQRVLQVVAMLVEAQATTLLYVSHHNEEQVPGIERTLSL